MLGDSYFFITSSKVDEEVDVIDPERIQRVEAFRLLMDSVDPATLNRVFLNTIGASHLHLFLLGLKPSASVDILNIDQELFHEMRKFFPVIESCPTKCFNPYTGQPEDKAFALLYDPASVGKRFSQYQKLLEEIGEDIEKFKSIPQFLNEFFGTIAPDPFLEGLILGYPIEDCMQYYLRKTPKETAEKDIKFKRREEIFSQWLQNAQGDKWAQIRETIRQLICAPSRLYASWAGFGQSEEFDLLERALNTIKEQTAYSEIMANAQRRYDEWQPVS